MNPFFADGHARLLSCAGGKAENCWLLHEQQIRGVFLRVTQNDDAVNCTRAECSDIRRQTSWSCAGKTQGQSLRAPIPTASADHSETRAYGEIGIRELAGQ